MAKKPPEMTPAEFELMKILWRLRSGTVAEVREELERASGTELAYTTVMTLLGRLAAKGALRVDKRRQPFVYQPTCRRESVLKHRLRDFLDTVFEGDADALVLQLVADDNLSVDELRRIERLIEDDEEGEE